MEVCEKAILIQQSMRRIMLHVCRKVNDRVNSKVDGRDSEDDEVQQEKFTRGQQVMLSHNARVVVECIRLINSLTQSSHGAAVLKD